MFRFFIAALLVATASNLFAGEAGIPKAVWKASRLIGSPDPPLPLRVERVFPELKLDEPVALRELPTGGRFIVLQRKGQILTFSSAGGATEADVAFDLEEDCKQRANEKIGAARDIELDPDFLANGFIYVVWSIAPWDVEAGTRVSRFTLGNQSPPKIDPQSRLDLLTYPSGDHIGASLRFGRDGYLYAANGDGSPPFPPDQHAAAQDLRDLRGSVLRIDVRHASSEKPYQVPADNPFLDVVGAKPEIYAFGIRNGFRSAFNPLDDSLWVADVGWERCELIHRIEKGGNHGWSLFEGPYPVKPNQPTAPGVCVTLAPRISPAIVMERSEAQSITGGVFLPHNATLVDHDPALENQYIYGCYMNGMVWTADVADLKNIRVTKCADSGLRLLDFVMVSLDDTPKGKKDLLAVDHAGGLYRFRPFRQNSVKRDCLRMSKNSVLRPVFMDGNRRLKCIAMVRQPRATLQIPAKAESAIINTVSFKRVWS
jgi:glucose/arabinose dehydrogenase